MKDRAVLVRCHQDQLVSTQLLTVKKWTSSCALTVGSLEYRTTNVSVGGAALMMMIQRTMELCATKKLILTALASRLLTAFLEVLLVYSPTNVLQKDGAGTAVMYLTASQERKETTGCRRA